MSLRLATIRNTAGVVASEGVEEDHTEVRVPRRHAGTLAKVGRTSAQERVNGETSRGKHWMVLGADGGRRNRLITVAVIWGLGER